MAIQRAQEDAWTKEMAKWEQRPVMVGGTYVQPIPFSEGGRGGAPVTEFPKMLYRAESAMGGVRISGCKIVGDESSERLACGQGWSVTQEQAIAAVAAQELELAKLAANRVHNEKWMSDKAKAEAREADESTMQHLPAIPETPKKRMGRPPKKSALVSSS
jgi:hypothetical protein